MGRTYGYGDGGRKMGGMGFGKRSTDYYSPEDDADYEYESEDVSSTLNYLQALEQYIRMMESQEEEKRGMASLARMSSQDSGPDEKRSLASVRNFVASKDRLGHLASQGLGEPGYKRGLGSLRGFTSGKRGLGSAMNGFRGSGKRGALSSLRSQGFTKYNI